MNNTPMTYLQAFMPLILIFGFLWFFMLRPQKKKDNAIKEMRKNLSAGDEIVTIGGIVGKVLTVKEDTFIMYVGNDKTKMEFQKWAVSEVTKKNEKAAKVEEPAEEPEKKKIRRLTKKADETEPVEK